MLKISPLASGSRGNSIFVSDGTTAVLIDCGLSASSLRERAEQTKVSLEHLSAVLITHEHTDHVLGVSALTNRYGIPVYAHPYVHNAMRAKCEIVNRKMLDVAAELTVGTLKITAFKTPHDSVYSLGYRIENALGESFGYATDLGTFTENVYRGLVGADAVMLESNHDIDMLKNGKYPDYLKRRILGPTGHLCNSECARAVLKFAERGTKTFILGHVSQENNLYDLALETTVNALADAGAAKEIRVEVARQDEPSSLVIG